ncbi:MAG: hypothetical protein MJZ34_07165 [Paludibacteraceae bacterium]|nr:hypothetical protein [Paludibacteraceae bacterium]
MKGLIKIDDTMYNLEYLIDFSVYIGQNEKSMEFQFMFNHIGCVTSEAYDFEDLKIDLNYDKMTSEEITAFRDTIIVKLANQIMYNDIDAFIDLRCIGVNIIQYAYEKLKQEKD